MGSKFNVPVVFSTEWSIALFLVFLILGVICHKKHKDGFEFGQVRMLPYQGLSYFFFAISIIAFIQLATHVLAMMAP